MLLIIIYQMITKKDVCCKEFLVLSLPLSHCTAVQFLHIIHTGQRPDKSCGKITHLCSCSYSEGDGD